MRRLARLAAALIGLGSAAPALGGSAALQSALQHRGFHGARLGVLVQRADDGRPLFEHNPDTALTPASNLKVLTALAALDTFGPAHQFTTAISVDALPDAAGAVGTLYVRGGGDPALTSEQWWRLAADLRRGGLRSVRGDIVLDDSFFEAQGWNPAWGAPSARAFHAPIAALSANYGAFAAAVRPGAQPGEPLLVDIDPPLPYLAVVNRGRTAAAGTAESLTVERRTGTGVEEVVIGGTLAAGEPQTVVYRSVADPVRYAGAVLRMQLAANGISVGGGTRVAPVAVGAVELLRFAGQPLGEIVQLFLKHSNNHIAETLLKGLGARESGPPGSWENGLRARRANLAALGVDTSGCTLIDGSGLASTNRVTPRALVAALRAAWRSFAIGPELIAALPIAARDGTLEKRAAAAAGVVRAKTGLINGATGLSGFARLRDGTDAAFSILVNGYDRGDADAMAGVDAFVATLVAQSAADLAR